MRLQNVSRRDFLKIMGMAGAIGGVGCGGREVDTRLIPSTLRLRSAQDRQSTHRRMPDHRKHSVA